MVLDYKHLDIKHLINNSKEIWENSSEIFPKKDLIKYNNEEKKNNEEQLELFINDLFYFLKNNSLDEIRNNQEEIKSIFEDYLQETFLFDIEEKKLFREDFLLESSELFIKKCRTYDPNMKIEDIGQALRNVWIMNLLQFAFNLSIKCTDSIYSYSMLYPYTDNLMDNTKIKKMEKEKYCERLSLRIKGFKMEPIDLIEKKIFHMIENIENEFSRKENPKVYESILSIHKAQIESLNQHNKFLETDDLIKKSFYKGGTSVLADGYLVKGDLTISEEEFCFNYGALLQLGDDLQDCEVDYKNSHSTIFSQIYKRKNYDNYVNKIINFIISTFNDNLNFEIKENKIIKRIMQRNCIMLVLGSSLINDKCFSSSYIKTIEKYFPLSKKYLFYIKKKLRKEFILLSEKYNYNK